MADGVSCLECRHFVMDTVGDGSGLGQCAEFERYLALNPSRSGVVQALLALGNRPDYPVFWGGTPDNKTRICGKYDGD